MEPIDFLEQQDRTAIKVCGITTPTQARDITALDVDALGVNFWPSSKRYLAPTIAQEWLPEICVETTVVAVFVNPSIEDLVDYYENELFDVAQLHGDESPEFCQQLAARDIPFIKALGVGDSAQLGDLDAYATRYLLLDAAQEGYGGGGHSFDWNLASDIIQSHPNHRILLAGGLTPITVKDAVITARPAAVDVASGVEASPGLKDLALVEDFVSLVRKAEGPPS